MALRSSPPCCWTPTIATFLEAAAGWTQVATNGRALRPAERIGFRGSRARWRPQQAKDPRHHRGAGSVRFRSQFLTVVDESASRLAAKSSAMILFRFELEARDSRVLKDAFWLLQKRTFEPDWKR